MSKYKLKHLLSALYFSVVFENLLEELVKLSKSKESKGSSKYIRLTLVLFWTKSLRYDEIKCVPSSDILTPLLNDSLEFRREPDINFDKLRQVLF